VRPPLRGEVYWTDLEPVVGSEQGGRRPTLVVQNDIGNRNAGTTIVVPITSSTAKAWYVVNVVMPDDVLPKASVAKCGQVRSIDKARLLGEPIARLDPATMARVDDALRISLGLR
jgi:mRNA interferase MazF